MSHSIYDTSRVCSWCGMALVKSIRRAPGVAKADTCVCGGALVSQDTPVLAQRDEAILEAARLRRRLRGQ